MGHKHQQGAVMSHGLGPQNKVRSKTSIDGHWRSCWGLSLKFHLVHCTCSIHPSYIFLSQPKVCLIHMNGPSCHVRKMMVLCTYRISSNSKVYSKSNICIWLLNLSNAFPGLWAWVNVHKTCWGGMQTRGRESENVHYYCRAQEFYLDHD